MKLSIDFINNQYLKLLIARKMDSAKQVRDKFWNQILYLSPDDAIGPILEQRDCGALIHFTSKIKTHSEFIVSAARAAALDQNKAFFRTAVLGLSYDDLREVDKAILSEMFWYLMKSRANGFADIVLLSPARNFFPAQDRANRQAVASARFVAAEKNVIRLQAISINQLVEKKRLAESKVLIEQFKNLIDCPQENLKDKFKSIPEEELLKMRETFYSFSPSQHDQIAQFISQLPLFIQQFFKQSLSAPKGIKV